MTGGGTPIFLADITQMASMRPNAAAAMLRQVNLRQLGARAHLFGEDGRDLGFCHLPMPVEAGDLAAVDGAVFRILGTLDGIPLGHTIDALAVVRPLRPVASR